MKYISKQIVNVLLVAKVAQFVLLRDGVLRPW